MISKEYVDGYERGLKHAKSECMLAIRAIVYSLPNKKIVVSNQIAMESMDTTLSTFVDPETKNQIYEVKTAMAFDKRSKIAIIKNSEE